MINSSNKNRRVLFLVDKSGFGGVQTIAYSLIERGVSPDIEMSFYFLRNINSRFKMEDIVGPNVRYAKSTLRYSLLPFLDILGLIRQQKVDILHLNGNKSVIFGVLLKKVFFPRLKLVAHDHGGVFDNSSWYPVLLKLSRRLIDRFITVSNYRKTFLVTRSDIDTDKVSVLDNFVDPARLGLSGVQKAEPLDRSDGHYVIGYIGGLSRIKGCDILIKAFAQVREAIPNARLVIAGDGPARGELELLAERLNVKEQVNFLGFVEKPGKVYAGFDLMVIPSRSEEGPICLYEAWLMGLPVVASNAHVLDERIMEGETGILFQSEDPDDLAQKILLAYGNKDIMMQIRDGGAQEVVHHSVENYLANLKGIYLGIYKI